MKPKVHVLRRKKLAAAISSITAPVVGFSPLTGFAQQDVIEEIIVTATRRETTVQDIPFNIAAVSGETLERQRLTNLADVSRWVPGLTLVDQGARASDILTVRA